MFESEKVSVFGWSCVKEREFSDETVELNMLWFCRHYGKRGKLDAAGWFGSRLPRLTNSVYKDFFFFFFFIKFKVKESFLF